MTDQVAGEFGSIADGWGSEWPLCKADCELQIVRPGKVQCVPCDTAADEEHMRDAIANGACPKCTRYGTAVYHGRMQPCER